MLVSDDLTAACEVAQVVNIRVCLGCLSDKQFKVNELVKIVARAENVGSQALPPIFTIAMACAEY